MTQNEKMIILSFGPADDHSLISCSVALDG